MGEKYETTNNAFRDSLVFGASIEEAATLRERSIWESDAFDSFQRAAIAEALANLTAASREARSRGVGELWRDDEYARQVADEELRAAQNLGAELSGLDDDAIGQGQTSSMKTEFGKQSRKH